MALDTGEQVSSGQAVDADGRSVVKERGPRTVTPWERQVAVSGTPVGSDTNFAAAVDFLSVICDKDCYFAKTSAGATSAANGDVDDRLFAASGERRILPWRSRGFWVVNANVGEVPANARVEGWVY